MFKATFDSLYQREVPAWFTDAKFGIWSHWGPQSVPGCGDWYARGMYIEGSAQYNHHVRNYGHPSKFGYKDIVQLWKAEKFDPDKLMDLYYKAGARYFVAQAMHHDHFFNYPSKYNRFNALQIGPLKDICGLWKAAADNYHMPFGLTEHLGASFSWMNMNKGRDKYGAYAGIPYDGNDPAYKDLYFENQEHPIEQDLANQMHLPTQWYTENKDFRDYWLNVMKELIDQYTPDFLYSDGGLPFGTYHTATIQDTNYRHGLEAVAYLYNQSIEKHGSNQAVYLQKDRRKEIHKVGILDIEKSQLPGIMPDPWHTDTCIGNWFYDERQPFKQPGHIIDMLVDIISKNGSMLLNIIQLPDGSINEEAHFILTELARWFDICAEAVHGTKPWRIFGEGESQVIIEGFKEEKVNWTSSDFRFMKNDKNLYAFMMKADQGKAAVIKSLHVDEIVKDVSLLGEGKLPFNQSYGVLTVKLPESLPTEYVNCLKIEL